MAENKTKVTAVDPHDFISRVDDEQKRKDSKELVVKSVAEMRRRYRCD